MNDKKDWEIERDEGHKITWWISKKTQKVNMGKNAK